MKAVYVEEDKILKYFIFGMNKKKDEIDSEVYQFKGIEIIKNRAFQNPWNVKRVFFDGALKTVEKEAFKDCKELEVFCCGKYSKKGYGKIKNLKINKLQKVENSLDAFTVQAFAFAGCENLHTVVFPECLKLTVEKSAFSGCESLRTIIALCDEISFTENPFEDCPAELTFVCKKDSPAERFARENGYRWINVQ